MKIRRYRFFLLAALSIILLISGIIPVKLAIAYYQSPSPQAILVLGGTPKREKFTANFAQNHMAPAIHAAKGAELAAIATSSPDKAAGFQAFAPGLHVFDSYDALLADPAIDAVYIPLPNHLHVAWTIKALEAGKHVLCEKPIGLQTSDFDALVAARDKAGKLAAEAFMIVHHPQFIRAR